MWDAALYALVALTAALALLDPTTAGRDRWLVVGLSALLAGWHLGFRRLGIRFLQLPIGEVEHVKVSLTTSARSAA